MIQSLLFDVFGTVVDWRTGVAREVAAAFAGKPDAPDPVAFADAWRAQYQPAMQRIRAGARGYVSLDDLHLENLERVLAAFDVGDTLTEAERLALNGAWEKLPPWPEVAGALARLKPQFIVAPCSNGSIALMTRLARYGGLPWDCILGADIARAYKPDPLAYRLSVAALRLAPDEVMMVAAHNDDLAAARAEGLATAFVTRPQEHGERHTTDLVPTDRWDVVARDFDDLADQLMQAEVGLSQSALSQHLGKLREAGMVATRREGQTIYYRLADEEARALMGALYAIFCA